MNFRGSFVAHIKAESAEGSNRAASYNGLCLSASYDAAFDKHLISFDNDYRMILSPALKDYYTNKAFKEYCLSHEGMGISVPQNHVSDLKLLDQHRQLLQD